MADTSPKIPFAVYLDADGLAELVKGGKPLSWHFSLRYEGMPFQAFEGPKNSALMYEGQFEFPAPASVAEAAVQHVQQKLKELRAQFTLGEQALLEEIGKLQSLPAPQER
jgi:hypothetical protein